MTIRIGCPDLSPGPGPAGDPDPDPLNPGPGVSVELLPAGAVRAGPATATHAHTGVPVRGRDDELAILGADTNRINSDRLRAAEHQMTAALRRYEESVRVAFPLGEARGSVDAEIARGAAEAVEAVRPLLAGIADLCGGDVESVNDMKVFFERVEETNSGTAGRGHH